MDIIPQNSHLIFLQLFNTDIIFPQDGKIFSKFSNFFFSPENTRLVLIQGQEIYFPPLLWILGFFVSAGLIKTVDNGCDFGGVFFFLLSKLLVFKRIDEKTIDGDVFDDDFENVFMFFVSWIVCFQED